MRAVKIEGYSYVTQEPLKMTRKEWQTLMRAEIAKGGKRRVECGETFVHGVPRHVINFEIYANIAP